MQYLLFLALVSSLSMQVCMATKCEAAGVPELDCYISPYLTVNIGSEVAGVIEQVLVERGDFVHKGQVVAQLESKVEKATLELKKARVEYLERDYNRKKDLYKDGIISYQENDQAETDLKMAQREMQEASEVYQRRIIKSTVDGIVVERFLGPGERVDDKPILKLAQIDPLNVEVIAPVNKLGSIKIGDHAVIKPEVPVKGELVGTVKIVDQVIDAASGTFGIRLELDNSNYLVPAGLKCQVQFLDRKKVAAKKPKVVSSIK